MKPVCMYVKYAEYECTATDQVFPCLTCPGRAEPLIYFRPTHPTEDTMKKSNVEKPTVEQIVDGDTLAAEYEAKWKALVAEGFTEDEAREILGGNSPIKEAESVSSDAISDAPESSIDAAGAPDAGPSDPVVPRVESLRDAAGLDITGVTIFPKDHPEGVHIDLTTVPATADYPAHRPATREEVRADEGAESEAEIEAVADVTVDLAASPEIGRAPLDEVVEVSESVMAPMSKSATMRRSSESDRSGSVETIEESVIGAKDVAEHIETAPAHVEIPETQLPIGTVLEKTPTGFKFVIPERGAIHGHGRSVAGAMLDAKLIR